MRSILIHRGILLCLTLSLVCCDRPTKKTSVASGANGAGEAASARAAASAKLEGESKRKKAKLSRTEKAKETAKLFGVKPILPGAKDIESEFSRIRLLESRSTRSLAFVRDNGRAVTESRMDLAHPEKLILPYTRTMFASYFYVPHLKRALIVGLGAGSMVRFLQHHDPKARIDALEIDPKVVEIAKDYFGLRESGIVKFIVADGYKYIRESKDKYNVIYMDAFLKPSGETDSTGVALQMKQLPFYDAIKQRLSPGGVVMFNLNVHPKINDDVKGIRKAFAHAEIYRSRRTNNYVVAASDSGKALTRQDVAKLGVKLDLRFGANFKFERMVGELMAPEDLPQKPGKPRKPKVKWNHKKK